MKLLFKQRLFSWFDSYDIYDEDGNSVYTVKGQLSWGHCLKIYDAYDNEVGTIQERIFTLLPKFEIYLGNQYAGCISKEFSFFIPRFNIDYNGWHVEGDFFEWDYKVLKEGRHIATISKKILSLTDTYIIDVIDEEALIVLMILRLMLKNFSRQFSIMAETFTILQRQMFNIQRDIMVLNQKI